MSPAPDGSELRLLRAFVVLMRERSVTRAAERLGLSQPAMSHVLARLRALLHDPLLLRGRNGMVPSARALEIEASVQGLLQAYDGLVDDASRFDPRTSARTFNVSAPEFAERMVMPPLLRALRRAAPGVRVVVHAPAATERALDLLESGTLDVRIAWLIPAPRGSLRSLRLFHDRLVCIADRRHRVVHGGVLTLEQFLTLPHVRTLGYSQTTTGRAIDDAIARRGRRIVPAQVVQSFVTMMLSIPGTDLIAIVPRLLAEGFEGRRELQLLEPPLPLPPVRYSAYWHERSQRDAGHRWFRELLAEVARPLAG